MADDQPTILSSVSSTVAISGGVFLALGCIHELGFMSYWDQSFMEYLSIADYAVMAVTFVVSKLILVTVSAAVIFFAHAVWLARGNPEARGIAELVREVFGASEALTKEKKKEFTDAVLMIAVVVGVFALLLWSVSYSIGYAGNLAFLGKFGAWLKGVHKWIVLGNGGSNLSLFVGILVFEILLVVSLGVIYLPDRATRVYAGVLAGVFLVGTWAALSGWLDAYAADVQDTRNAVIVWKPDALPAAAGEVTADAKSLKQGDVVLLRIFSSGLLVKYLSPSPFVAFVSRDAVAAISYPRAP